MRKLYLRIYLAVLASLAVFVLATAVLWRQVGQHGAQGCLLYTSDAATILLV